VRVDPATVVCWGSGRAVVRRGVRRWTRFTCLTPTFRGGRAGPDLEFVVVPRAKSFAVVRAKLTSY